MTCVVKFNGFYAQEIISLLSTHTKALFNILVNKYKQSSHVCTTPIWKKEANTANNVLLSVVHK